MLRRLTLVAAMSLALSATIARAADEKVPFWGAIRAKEVNMRVGPGEDYRIAWVYHRPQLPLKVLRIMEGWWLVEDPDGARGWVLGQFMVKKRTVMVVGKGLAEMHTEASDSSKLLWRLEPGVTGRLGDCDPAWCEVDLGAGRTGFVKRARLWGAAEL